VSRCGGSGIISGYGHDCGGDERLCQSRCPIQVPEQCPGCEDCEICLNPDHSNYISDDSIIEQCPACGEPIVVTII